jgi:hypothetical protein
MASKRNTSSMSRAATAAALRKQHAGKSGRDWYRNNGAVSAMSLEDCPGGTSKRNWYGAGRSSTKPRPRRPAGGGTMLSHGY